MFPLRTSSILTFFDFNISTSQNSHFEDPTAIHQEIRARLKWAAKATEQEESSDTTEGSVTTSDTVRYALFLVAGLISVAQSQALEAWIGRWLMPTERLGIR